MRTLQLVKTSVGATWALKQMRHLVQQGVEVHVCLPPSGPLVPQYEASGIIVHPLWLDLPVRQPWQLPALLSAFRHLVNRVQPDIIHSHFVGTTLMMRLALGSRHPIPRVFQVPGPLHLEYPLYRQAEIATASAPDYWIGSCRWTCNTYRRMGIAAARVFLSYYGTDLPDFQPAPAGKLRRELGVGKDVKLVGMVAYMYPPKWYLGQTRGLKGHEDLIDALAIALRSEPNLLGVFIGGAWNHATAYERRVRVYGQRQCQDRALFLGTRYDVPELYPDFDVVVHPSHSENVGGAVESLLLAVPTIATHVGGFPDLVTHGQTGWLVPPRHPARLAEAILDALQHPAEGRRRAIRGQQRAQQMFDVCKAAAQILQIYQTILDNHPRRPNNDGVAKLS